MQLNFLGHVMRRHCFENLAVTGKVDGRRGRGRHRLKYLDSLCTCLKDKVNPIELIRASEYRKLWPYMVANVVEDDLALPRSFLMSEDRRSPTRTPRISTRFCLLHVEHNLQRVFLSIV